MADRVSLLPRRIVSEQCSAREFRCCLDASNLGFVASVVSPRPKALFALGRVRTVFDGPDMTVVVKIIGMDFSSPNGTTILSSVEVNRLR